MLVQPVRGSNGTNTEQAFRGQVAMPYHSFSFCGSGALVTR